MSDFFSFVVARRNDILTQTTQHLYLTLIALLFAILIGVLIGIVLTRYRKTAATALGVLGVIQTIPSLALLGFMLPILGIGAVPAIVALFLYALLPIVRNTYTGIVEVEASVIEAARGMGMSPLQILTQVELPLAIPVIFAGIRTAVVINVGIATLCSLIGAGGLGEFIFSGISLVNSNMTLAGAIPAALLALLLDGILALIQKYIQQILRPVLIIFTVLAIGLLIYTARPLFTTNTDFVAGFDTEFYERADGYPSLKRTYGLRFDRVVELEPGLMYEALKEEKVNVISGFATEGKIAAYNLRVLKDDQRTFPPYFVAPVFNGETLQRYPELKSVFEKIAQKIPDSTMRRLNYQVDKLKENPSRVARAFLKELGLKNKVVRNGSPDLLIGGKKFTEQYILLELFKALIENYTNLTVGLKKGMGGTQIVFNAVRLGEIDMYPEYTGTALLVILKTDNERKDKLINSENNAEKIYQYVKKECKERYDVVWLEHLGFNNTYALMMREEQAARHEIKTISDLRDYLESSN